MIVATADEASSGGSKQGRITKRGWKGNEKWKNGGREGGITKEGL